MSKQTARSHKQAARRVDVARTQQRNMVRRGKPAAKTTPARGISAVKTKPPSVSLIELELLLNDPDESVTDDVLVTGFEDGDL